METPVIHTTGATDSVDVPDIQSNEIELREELGRGCFGVVYKGKCRGMVVAVKQLHHQTLYKDSLDEFKREIQFLTHLRHPNIILFMGACTEQGKLAIVTEYLGGDLYTFIHGKGLHLPLVKTLAMARDIAKGMNWLHLSKPPIIHRDLKPTNLLVDDNLNVKICDFGLSAWQLKKTLQDQGSAPGTPLWMSPEVLQSRPLTEKADVYSFGIVFWEMLTHKEPFEHHNDYETFVTAICVNRERPEIPKDMHSSLSRLLSRCWHHNPDKRCSFEKIIQRLEDAMVDTCINHSGCAILWKTSYTGQLQVSWNTFSVDLYSLLSLPFPPPNDIGYRCLRVLLCGHDKTRVSAAQGEGDVGGGVVGGLDSMECVTLERFGLFSKWFHPLNGIVIKRLTETMSLPFFHGPITRAESERILMQGDDKKNYLVRFSMTEPESSPFTLSKLVRQRHATIGGNITAAVATTASSINGSGGGGTKISHLRLNVVPEKMGVLTIQTLDKKNKTVELQFTEGLKSLWEDNDARKILQLKDPCPGGGYLSIFQPEPVSAYEEDGGVDNNNATTTAKGGHTPQKGKNEK